MNSSRSALFSCVSISTLCLAASPAFAQSANEPSAGQDAEATRSQDIIVTARRTEERLQDVPISITVFNQEQLSDRNVVSAGDLAKYTPSLSTNSRFGLRRMRWRGLAKAAAQVHLTAIAYNLKRTMNILAAQV